MNIKQFSKEHLSAVLGELIGVKNGLEDFIDIRDTECSGIDVDGRFYKNTKVEAKIGDLVKCGLSTAVVCSISEKDEPNAVVKNCAVEGKLHLNCVSEAELVEKWEGLFEEKYNERNI